jgi:hypothetical protein
MTELHTVSNIEEQIKAARAEIIHIAAELTTGNRLMSTFKEDYEQRVPKSVMRQIIDSRNHTSNMAVRLKAVYDSLSLKNLGLNASQEG